MPADDTIFYPLGTDKNLIVISAEKLPDDGFSYFHNVTNILFRDGIRRCQENMVASSAINGASAGVKRDVIRLLHGWS